MLNASGRKGIITLLCKKNTDFTGLKSRRPITLLNLDYKMLAKVLADRMKKSIT